ncbi:hypothetical protein CLU80_0046 [Pseudomonas sp. 29]|uniref:hypothetical protein n=1 Tax=Pseudomonas sp. 29 TaxID=2035197 RepID=UPI000C1759D7|nr:hypothetical protein [Pseudomonas sp. 29]PIF47826.1 hypothetical protein CLU80_0046 [Pseudomonas sp. 29]
MNRLVSVRTEDLAGPALDWAINAIEGDQQPGTGQMDLFALPDAEQLITKYGVWVDVGHRHRWLADMTNDPFNRQTGETRTIAVFRSVVFARCGAAVKVPAELIQQ